MATDQQVKDPKTPKLIAGISSDSHFTHVTSPDNWDGKQCLGLVFGQGLDVSRLMSQLPPARRANVVTVIVDDPFLRQQLGLPPLRTSLKHTLFPLVFLPLLVILLGLLLGRCGC